MTWYREWFGEEYLDLYSYRDEEEARHHVAFFQEHVGAVRGTLLDLACGSGRHLQEFGLAGYSAIGCDLSFILLRNAVRQSGTSRVVRADMRSLPFCDASFAALVSFFTSFGYFEHEEENAIVIREMCRVLSRDAPVLFDYLNVHRELRGLVQKETRDTDAGVIEIERWFDAASRTFNKRITIAGKRFLERVRGYDLDEISALFAANGLGIRQVYGDFDAAPFDEKSPRLIVIGIKRR
ncbi:MAG TPA: class I SAM-dependent methyltransferase [Thermoanaerobaculia bacterium]